METGGKSGGEASTLVEEWRSGGPLLLHWVQAPNLRHSDVMSFINEEIGTQGRPGVLGEHSFNLDHIESDSPNKYIAIARNICL